MYLKILNTEKLFNFLNNSENLNFLIEKKDSKMSFFIKEEQINSNLTEDSLNFQKENILFPKNSYILIRSKHKIDIKNRLKFYENKNELKTIREDFFKNLKFKYLSYYQPYKGKDILSIIKQIPLKDRILIEIDIKKVKYDISDEINLLNHQLNIINKILNNEFNTILYKNIPQYVINKIFKNKINDYVFNLAQEKLKIIKNSLEKKDVFFTKIKIYSSEDILEELNSYIDLNYVRWIKSDEIKNRLELFFSKDELDILLFKISKKDDLEAFNRKNLIVLDKKYISIENHEINTKSINLRDLNSLNIIYNNKEEVKTFIQSILLFNILKNIEDGNKIKIYNIDLSLDYFLYKLDFLKQFNCIFNDITDEKELNNTLNLLKYEIKKRKNKFIKFGDIYNFNNNIEMENLKEPIIIVVLNIDYFNSNENYKEIIKTCINDSKLGIYFIMYSMKKSIIYETDTIIEIKNKININTNNTVNVNSLFNIESLINKIKLILKEKNKNNNFLEVPIGKDNFANEIEFILGDQFQTYHSIIIGTTGSGKTSLINNILYETSKRYSPDEVSFILMDYKPGSIEFIRFKQNPNVKIIVANPNDFQIALKTFLYIKYIIEKRAQLFHDLSVKDINEYNSLNNIQKIKRIIVIIDEFQRLLNKEFSDNKHLNQYLSDFMRVGRAYGIHFILSTQSLQNIKLNDDILSSIKLRIALKVNDKYDLGRIFDHNSNELILNLNKYQAIYNSDGGREKANILVNLYPPQKILNDELNHSNKNQAIIIKSLEDFDKKINSQKIINSQEDYYTNNNRINIDNSLIEYMEKRKQEMEK